MSNLSLFPTRDASPHKINRKNKLLRKEPTYTDEQMANIRNISPLNSRKGSVIREGTGGFNLNLMNVAKEEINEILDDISPTLPMDRNRKSGLNAAVLAPQEPLSGFGDINN